MESKTIANGILRAVAVLAGIVGLAYLVYLLQPIIVYVLVASLVALIGRPLVLIFRRRLKLPKILAILLYILLFLGIILGLISLFIPVLVDQGKNLALLDFNAFQEKLNELNRELDELIGHSPFHLGEMLESQELENKLFSGLDMSFIPKVLNGVLSMLGSFSIGLLSVLFISFFLLKDTHLLQRIILAFVPTSQETGVIHSLNKIKNMLSRYFLGLIGQILILFVIYTITLLLVGVPNPLVIGFICALFNIIPWIGPVIALVLMVVLTMTSHLGADWNTVILPDVGWVLLGFGISQLIDNFFSQPLIFANAVKLHPLEIFLVILAAGLLFGILGMIIAIPGYTALKVILKEFLSENKAVKRLLKNV